MKYELNHPLSSLKGIGPKTANIFYKHGMRTLEDLLYFFPRAWIDASRVTLLAKAKINQPMLCDVAVVESKTGISFNSRLPYIRSTVADTSGFVDAMWFRQLYLKNKLIPGSRHLLYGSLHRWRAGQRMLVSPKFMMRPQIVPVYCEIGGLGSEKIRRLIGDILLKMELPTDHISPKICKQLDVTNLKTALQHIHAPNNLGDIARAKDRFGFEELIMLAVPSLLAKQARERETAKKVTPNRQAIEAWIKTLPFALTADQKRAIQTILGDISLQRPMNRLLQGDVGSGKTVVALAACVATSLVGKQVVWLAPTELLAVQHFQTAQLLTRRTSLSKIALWTRSQKKLNQLAAEADNIRHAQLIIGTHAALKTDVSFPNLGLLIIDEQHRFGVKQRAMLRKVSDQTVHLLSMTATPIPRTMALTIYGDLDVSTIKQKPLGRKSVITRVVESTNRDKAYKFIDDHITAGRQVYVVCPIIEPSSDTEASVFVSLFQPVEETKAVKTWVAEMKKVFPHRRVGLLHGKMKSHEKTDTMDKFRKGLLDILVTTSLIEVGLDVPNAAVIMIESAERFGLATLHQLRGRVGRSDQQSFCLLFPSSDEKKENTRLQLLEKTDDGFALAEKDLELRGPGELIGLAQSGLPKLKFATFNDLVKVEKIKAVLAELITIPQFQAAVDRFWRLYHPE